MIKKQHPECKVVFIGPCAAKKLEASRRSVRSDVDFVLTFEETMGLFDAKAVDFKSLEVEDHFRHQVHLEKDLLQVVVLPRLLLRLLMKCDLIWKLKQLRLKVWPNVKRCL